VDWSLLSWGPTGWGDELARGFVLTIALAVVSYAIGTAAGLALGALSATRSRALRRGAEVYGLLFRSLPELLVIFFVFYGLGFGLGQLSAVLGLGSPITISPFAAGVIALSVVHAAYAAEVFRGSISNVPRGLVEAGLSLGLSSRLVALRITLPVMLRYAFPGLANLWMVMIKNTPLVSAIGLADLIRQAETAGANTRAYFLFFFVALGVYLIVSAASMWGQSRAERQLFRHMRAPGT
jgi:polar amino acid transport system permease protein